MYLKMYFTLQKKNKGKFDRKSEQLTYLPRSKATGRGENSNNIVRSELFNFLLEYRYIGGQTVFRFDSVNYNWR